ncbi:MAG TPA: SDR family oxidoreductase [Pseudolabrys sp.]|nr:SDR family oxidoreductase [Pseudolabrys sp.]
MTVLVLGAAGLIGNVIAADLIRRGIPVVAAARRFTPEQRDSLGAAAREMPIAALDSAALARLIDDCAADVVVNCLGVLQDAGADSTQAVHQAFVERLLAALRAIRRPVLLVHLSILGAAASDGTNFSRSKRAAEDAIAKSGLPYAILRPGFVFAPRAYGGSAMLRALAALPLALPSALASRPLATVAVEDIAETVHVLAQQWQKPDPRHAAIWDVMQPDTLTIGDVTASLRRWLGADRRWRIPLPMALFKLGALTGDASAWLGWRPPVRSTALIELMRGIAGDPRPWMAATKIMPRPLGDVLWARPATVQEKWFARIYPLKALIVGILAVFWCASSLIVLTVAFPAAVAIFTAHGFQLGLAQVLTVASCLTDLSVGVAIAFRRTHVYGLGAGIAVSLFYMAGAAILTPELWIEPLGALVKTGPAIVLMLVALAIADDR